MLRGQITFNITESMTLQFYTIPALACNAFQKLRLNNVALDAIPIISIALPPSVKPSGFADESRPAVGSLFLHDLLHGVAYAGYSVEHCCPGSLAEGILSGFAI